NSLECRGPARFRCDAGDHTRFAVYQGRCTIEGHPGKTTLASGDYLDLRDPNSPYEIRPLSTHDRFDNWCDGRDRLYDGYTRRHAYRSLPPNIAVVSDGLDDYGTWRTVPRYGHVWCPRVANGWRPYRQGHWVWVDPYGWTWVSDEPWGWAPYHYGTWV